MVTKKKENKTVSKSEKKVSKEKKVVPKEKKVVSKKNKAIVVEKVVASPKKKVLDEKIDASCELDKLRTEFNSSLADLKKDLNSKILLIDVPNKNSGGIGQDVYDKIDELVDKFNTLTSINEEEFSERANRLDKKLQNTVNDLRDKLSEKVSQDIISKNKFLDNIKEQVKKLSDDVTVGIENKFVENKKVFDSDFSLSVLDVKTKLSEASSKIQERFDSLDDKFSEVKSGVLKTVDEDLLKTKDLVYSHIENLNDELHLLKKESIKLEHERATILDEFNFLVEKKIGEVSSGLHKDIYDDVKERLDSDMSTVDLLQATLQAREKELNDKITYFEESLEGIFVKIDLQEKSFEKKISENFLEEKSKIDALKKELFARVDDNENRVSQTVDVFTSNVKKLSDENADVVSKFDGFVDNVNDRFSSFESSVARDVSGLIKDVEVVFQNKIDSNREVLDRVSELNNKVVKNINELVLTKDSLGVQVSALKTEIDNLKGGKSMMGDDMMIIQGMAVYEKRLVDTIKRLKNLGQDEEQIKRTLVAKGHPIFYVSMIIENLPFIYQ